MAWTLDGISYEKRKEISVQTANLDSNLTDFPLLVHFEGDADIGAACDANGYEIRFTASDGETLLKYERESFSITSDEATGIFWVKTDLSTSGTSIYIYYDADSTSDGEDAANVWDSNHKGVWHLGESSGSAKDSTSNNKDGTFNGDLPTPQTGIVGNGQYFDGSGDYINPGLVHDGDNDNLTVSAWFKPSNITSSMFLFGSRASGGWQFQFSGHRVGDPLSFVATSRFDAKSGTSGIAAGTWYHVCVTYDRSSVRFYKNGSQFASVAKNLTIIALSSDQYVGGMNYSGGPYPVYGYLDEVRVSDSARNAAWVKFEFRNMAEADNELTFGSEEPAGPAITFVPQIIWYH